MKKRIVALSGGIGNQMFQYAFGRYLEINKNCTVEFDTAFFESSGDRNLELGDLNICAHEFENHPFFNTVRLFVQRIPLLSWLAGCYKEYREFEVDDRIIKRNYVFYSGCWQNKDYSSGMIDLLRREFCYSKELSPEIFELNKQIKGFGSIAVHVRRGDYQSEQLKNKYVCQDLDYYNRSISCAKDMVSGASPQIYVFSDDIEWCRSNFENDNTVFVDDSISKSVHTDMLLMKNARCLIMANSTFSWWAARLSEREDKIVFMPERWYKDNELNRKAVNALRVDGWILL